MGTRLKDRTWVSDLVIVLPSFVFVLSILLVRLHQFSMPLTNIYWSAATDTTTLSDLFGYWKAVAILFAALLSVVILVIGYLKDLIRIKKSFLYIPGLLYLIFVLISLAFSDYKYFAIRGMQEHFEGTFVLFSYILMTFFLFNIVDSERRLKYVIYCALFAALLLGLLGITQAIGHDFLSTVVGQKMMTPNYMLASGITSWEMIDLLAATGQSAYGYLFSAGEVYQTVYNINYVPLYLSLLLPISVLLFLYFGLNENKSKRAIAAIFLVLFGIISYNFFAANSSSGYFGLLASLIAFIIIIRKSLKRWIKLILCLIVTLGLIMGMLADRWLPEFKAMLKSAIVSVSIPVYADDIPGVQYNYDNPANSIWIPVDYIETRPTQIEFGINGSALLITRDDTNASFTITDVDGQQLYLRSIENENGTFELLDERFHDYMKLSLVKKEGNYCVIITTFWCDWLFPFNGQSFSYQNNFGKNVELTRIPHSTFIKDYKFGSKRGLIWDTTIPILKTKVLYGSGADTFTFVYPQNDYATQYNVYDRSLTLVTDKAHNLFMQYWVNTGLLSLLSWLVLVGFYLVGAIKSFRNRGFEEMSDFVNAGIFCGIIGFLFVALFNDGSVNTMPMFYTMLGTGLAINAKEKWISSEVADDSLALMPEV